MKANRGVRWSLREDSAVTDVLGAILLVGITIGMAVGLGILLMSVDGPRDRVHADIRITLSPGGPAWGDGDEEVRLRHLGGESLRTADTQVRVTVDGTVHVFSGAGLDGGFADGEFRIGESWSGVMTIPVNASVDVRVIDTSARDVVGSSMLIASPAAASGDPPVFTYVDSIAVAIGSLSDEDAAKDADDGGAAASLEEAFVAGGSSSSRRDPGGVAASSGADDPANALASDDARARLDAASERIAVNGFTVPGSILTIDALRIGFEGHKGGSGGQDPDIRLTYSGPSGGTFSSQTFSVSGSSDSDRILDVSGDRVWTTADVESLQVRIEYTSTHSAARPALIDHIFVEVDYSTAASNDLDATLAWSGVPDRSNHVLQIRYATSGDTFAMQVWDGDKWVVRGSLTSTTYSIFTYTLQSGEWNGGAPQMRLLDLDSDPSAGQIDIDYARVSSV